LALTSVQSVVLLAMTQQAAFEHERAAAANLTDIAISNDAVISRLRPIQDGLDYWQEHRSSANTDPGGSAPAWVMGMFRPIWEGPYNEDFPKAHITDGEFMV
jgi:hypothetical protein